MARDERGRELSAAGALLRLHRPAAAAGTRVHVPLALGAAVTVAALVHATLALRIESTWIVPDELIYSELAKSLGMGGSPQIRGESAYGVVGLGYPLLLAPVWAVFDDPTTAYAVARVVNALLLALTAIPAYFLALRFVRPALALVVASLAVLVPSMLYAGTLMTEVVLYPVFVTALLALATAVERPRVAWQLATLATIGAACTVKMVAVVLIPAYVLAILLHDRLERRDGVRPASVARTYAATWIALGAGALVVGAGLVASGRRPSDLLGAYSVVLGNLDPLSTPWWALLHLAELDLYLGVVPFALTVAVAAKGLARGAERRERLFASVALPVVAMVVLVVGAFASTPAPGGESYPENVSRLHERSTFMLAPLFLVGLVMWLDGPRTRRAPWVALAIAAALPLAIPLWTFDEHVRFQALALVPWVEMRGDVAREVGVLAFTATLALFFVLAARMRVSAVLVLAPIVFVFVSVGLAAHVSMREASAGARAATSGSETDWVDRAVGADADVSVLWAERPGRPFVELRRRHYALFVGEFFNRSLGRVYEIGSPLPYALPTTRASLDGDRVVLDDGAPARFGEYVLAPCWLRVEGSLVTRDPGTGAAVYHVVGDVRARVEPPESCT